ncbi:MAG: YihY family inner membrane protein [Burkholderiales bacterium]|jgi:membrane protein
MFARTRAFATFIIRVVRRLRATNFARIAASLSFTTLLGLVPLFTVAFAYVAPYSMFEHWLNALEPVLLKFLLPGSSGTVRQYLAEFTAKTAALKGVGTAIVVLTAVLLVAQVEREINAIWGVYEARSLLRRFLVYALGFVAVPALIGAAVYATSWLIDTSIAAVPIASAALPFVARPFSLALGTVLLTLVYKLVPARHVPLRAAFISGLLAAAAFEAAKYGFAFYITHVPTYEIVYGALAALPLFLIWIYVCWIILLAGAAVAATLAEHRWGRGRKPRRQ